MTPQRRGCGGGRPPPRDLRRGGSGGVGEVGSPPCGPAALSVNVRAVRRGAKNFDGDLPKKKMERAVKTRLQEAFNNTLQQRVGGIVGVTPFVTCGAARPPAACRCTTKKISAPCAPSRRKKMAAALGALSNSLLCSSDISEQALSIRLLLQYECLIHLSTHLWRPARVLLSGLPDLAAQRRSTRKLSKNQRFRTLFLGRERRNSARRRNVDQILENRRLSTASSRP